MKILVIGGTGLIGGKVSRLLADEGHTVVIGAPSTGVDLITGKGLREAMDGIEIVIDLSNSSSPEEETAIAFFTTAGNNLVAAEQAASVKHHVLLSIVGTDRALDIGYLRAKKTQEDLAAASGIPYTIVRSTQFHEHITTLISMQADEQGVQVSTMDYQPIAADDVARLVAEIALEQPANGIIEIAGPGRAPMSEFVSGYLRAKGSGTRVIPNDDNRYMSFKMSKSGLVPLGDFRSGRIPFSEWAAS